MVSMLLALQIAPAQFVLYFNVSDETMTKRLLGRAATSGRVDDNEETIKKRLVTFHDVTKPVIEHFQSQGKVREVRQRQKYIGMYINALTQDFMKKIRTWFICHIF